MTRVNSGIKPSELCDKHLIGEYHEIPRLTSLLKKRIAKFGEPHHVLWGLPEEFCLGSGHMLFFMSRGKYLERRFNALLKEMDHRGYTHNFTWDTETWSQDPAYYNDWKPDSRVKKMMRKRLKQKLPPNARYTNREQPDWSKS